VQILAGDVVAGAQPPPDRAVALPPDDDHAILLGKN
jgi:hypothetical protein